MHLLVKHNFKKKTRNYTRKWKHPSCQASISMRLAMMMPMHFAKRHEVASKGAMVQRLKLLTNVLATSSTKMMTIPFPDKMAFHNVKR